MNHTIQYTIRFYSYWHCGSGLAAGASADALVLRDCQGLPFVPGKSIKGLLREVMEETSILPEEQLEKIFGTRPEDSEGRVNPGGCQGCCYFTNAVLSDVEATIIVGNSWQGHLYAIKASTAIDEESGTAKDFSLRTIEVVVPCELQGEITGLKEEWKEAMVASMRLIKRIGVNRNRGLGRCDIIIEWGNRMK